MPDAATLSTSPKQKLFVWLLPILALSIVAGWYFVHEKLTPISLSQDALGKVIMHVPNGWPNRWIDRAPTPRNLAETINFPVLLPAVLLELSLFGTEHPDHFEQVRIIECSLIGTVFWIFVGLYLDRLRYSRRAGISTGQSRWFAVILTSLTIIGLVTESAGWGGLQTWAFAAAVGWASIAVFAILFRPRNELRSRG